MSLKETYVARAQNFFERRRGVAPADMRVLRANSSFSDARIIGFADWNHGVEKSSGVCDAALAMVATPDDIILVEGLEKGQPSTEETALEHGFIPGVRVYGWDNMEAFRNALAAHTEGFGDLFANFLGNDQVDFFNAQRDDSLVQAVDEAKRLNPARVLISAGRAHLIGNRGLLNYLENERYTIITPEGRRTRPSKNAFNYTVELYNRTTR